MTKKIFVLLSIFLALILLPYYGQSAVAMPTDRLAVALVIDNSGSMRTTDPLGKRFTASRMLLELLNESDYFSITTFTTQARDLLPMTELSSQHLVEARSILEEIPAATGDTDYLGALAQAELNLAKISETDIRKSIIFLTDGIPDPGVGVLDMDDYMDVLRTKVQALGAQDIPVYTVGFGDSDQEILEEMSALTKGAAFEGDSTTIASNFFGIVQELKNQYTLLDEEVSGTIEEPLIIDMNEYTSRITILIQDEAGTGDLQISDGEEQILRPDFQADGVRLYHIHEDPLKANAEYTLTGELIGRVMAVRETKTKLWINESLQNAQFPMNAKITARVSQTGTTGATGELRGILRQNGVRMNHSIEVKKTGEKFEVSLDGLPQSGVYELELGLYVRNELITKTSTSFELKNLPVLVTNLLDQSSQIVIAGEPKDITASLVRSGQAIKQGMDDLQLTLELLHNGEKLAIVMKDDGKAASGDVIPGDGVFTARVSFQETGTIAGIVSARGILLDESILLTSRTAESKVLEPGRVDIQLPEMVYREGNSSAAMKIDATSHSEYPEEISITLNGELLNIPPIRLAPGESVTRQINVDLPSDAEEAGLILNFRPLYGVTEVNTASNRIRVSTRNSETSLISSPLLLIIGALTLLLLGGFLLLRKRPQRQKARLRGVLQYHDPVEEASTVLVLEGSSPISYSIGPGPKSSHHVPADIEQPFSFTFYPILSGRDNELVEIRCSPPGVLVSQGQVKTSMLLTRGDIFTMGGIEFEFNLGGEEVTGHNVLKGKG